MTHEEAIDKVTDYIMEEMSEGDAWDEVNWLLSQVYTSKRFDELLDDWNFNKKGEIQ